MEKVRCQLIFVPDHLTKDFFRWKKCAVDEKRSLAVDFCTGSVDEELFPSTKVRRQLKKDRRRLIFVPDQLTDD